MGGGDLLNLLIEKDVFDEPFTRFYVAEVGHFPPHLISWLELIDNNFRWLWLSNHVTNMALFIATSSLT
jgi:hypothetical protein